MIKSAEIQRPYLLGHGGRHSRIVSLHTAHRRQNATYGLSALLTHDQVQNIVVWLSCKSGGFHIYITVSFLRKTYELGKLGNFLTN